jgi:hypothetical protein
MQSSFKSPPPSFIEEIQRDMRAIVMHARHIVFMGYSLPADDVDYRALFAACSHSQTRVANSVRCTIVDVHPARLGWCTPDDLAKQDVPVPSVVNAASDLFGRENVRYFGRGVPEVFLEEHGVSEKALEGLLTWSLP